MAVKIPSFLQRTQCGIYRFRRRVPDDLRVHLGECEILCSLHTRYPREAQRLGRLAAVNTDQLFRANHMSDDDLTVELTVRW